MANYTLSPEPYLHFEYTDGRPVAAGQVFTYLAGTTTPATTYSTSSGTTNTNPIILDAGGNCSVFLAPGSYRYDVYDSVVNGGALLAYLSKDNISAVPTGSSDTDIDGIAGTTITSGQVVYLSDGSGALTAGRWYPAKADNAYSSTTPEIGFAVNDIASGVSGSIRLIGRMTAGLSVTVGLLYYISSSSAGAVTSTAPALSRFVGMADSGTSMVISPDPPSALNQNNDVVDFRLSLTTGVPYTTADVLAATTIFCTPSGHGNRMALFNSAGVVTIYTSAEFSIAVPATTVQMYDVFCFANASTPTLELLAWTNDTTRATAIVLTTTGTYTKSGDLTRRYLGSFRTTGVSGQTESSLAKRFLWNYYNRMPLEMEVREATGSWTYTLAAFREARGQTTNILQYVIGVAEVLADLLVGVSQGNSSVNVVAAVAIGHDSTSVPHASCIGAEKYSDGNSLAPMRSTLKLYPTVGYHFDAWLEYSAATGTSTWYSTNILTAAAGISGWIQG